MFCLSVVLVKLSVLAKLLA